MTSDREEDMEDEGQEPSQQPSSQASQSRPEPTAGEQQPAAKNKRGRKPNNPEYPCLCCGENCTKSQAAVKCIMCTLWAHKDCVKMPDNTFKLLEEQVKESGSAYWVCRPCQQFGQRIKHQINETNKRQDENEKKTEENRRRLDGTDKRMDMLEREMKKMAERLDNDGGEREDRLCDEMQEREVRRMNLIIHGIEEPPERVKINRERLEIDKSRCEQLFTAMKARTKKEDLRFCRRIGEKTAGPRPMVIGLETEEEKRHILARARNLQGTAYQDISVVPDLTKKQRAREADMKREADERNKNLTNEDRNRNEKWLVVGRRGEKRLIKGVERDIQYMGNRTGTATTRPETAAVRYEAPNTRPVVASQPLLPSAPPRGPFQPRQEAPDNNTRGYEEDGRWYRKDKDGHDTGAIRKDTYGQGNKTGGERDQQETSRQSRWETTSDRSDRWAQPRDRLASKRGRGSGSSEDEIPSRQRSKRF
jgi:hypothetical protein